MYADVGPLWRVRGRIHVIVGLVFYPGAQTINDLRPILHYGGQVIVRRRKNVVPGIFSVGVKQRKNAGDIHDVRTGPPAVVQTGVRETGFSMVGDQVVRLGTLAEWTSVDTVQRLNSAHRGPEIDTDGVVCQSLGSQVLAGARTGITNLRAERAAQHQ